MMYILALIHTFPYIIYHQRKGDMSQQWNTSVAYWTGVVALLAQTWLTFAALVPIRRRWYEFFKSTHLIAAVIFIIFFFVHCDFRLPSWYQLPLTTE
jgi:ferric-chelate reductase